MTKPNWRKINPDKLPKEHAYFYLRCGNSIQKELMNSPFQWRGLLASGFTHYMTESDLLSIPKEK